MGGFSVSDVRRCVWAVSKMRLKVHGFGGNRASSSSSSSDGGSPPSPERMSQLSEKCGLLMSRLASEAATMSLSLTASDMRIVLQAFVSLGFPADEMADRFEEEAGRRLSMLSEPDERVGGRDWTIVGMVREAAEMGEAAEAVRVEEEKRGGRRRRRKGAEGEGGAAGGESAAAQRAGNATFIRSLASESSRRLNRVSSGAR